MKGKFAEQHVPKYLRKLIKGESAANDGLAYPLFFLPILFIHEKGGTATWQWFVWVILYQIVLMVIIGFVLGYVLDRLLNLVTKMEIVDKTSFLAFTIALVFLVLGRRESLRGVEICIVVELRAFFRDI